MQNHLKEIYLAPGASGTVQCLECLISWISCLSCPTLFSSSGEVCPTYSTGLQIFQSKAAAMRSCGDAIATINSRLSKKPPKVLASLPPQKEASEMKTTTTTTRC
ncbi:uncharacterized protein LOC130729979 isoform X3 [Lotus japonicus]|uniref:uncharacterized protein LOC130729979 isoform X3 n=1 Tax=Lotus japonicus TaxID=34305 RepID=UPI0025876903|nr:uncharacterized protein LOC130729979 isoform X3 [Lotus japonicus]